jgi:hypothetical protein
LPVVPPGDHGLMLPGNMCSCRSNFMDKPKPLGVVRRILERPREAEAAAIVWPEELAPGKPRFPTPPWSQR